MSASPKTRTLKSASQITSARSKLYSTQAALARTHPLYLAEFVFRLKARKFDRLWHDAVLGEKRAIIEAPVEHGKTTQLSVVAGTWLIGDNPDRRLISISNSADQAKQRLGQIKTVIEHSWRLKMAFPDRINEKTGWPIPGLRREQRRGWPNAWLQDRIIVERSPRAALQQKEYSIQAIGYQGKFLGARIDGAILDDVLDNDNTNSPKLRENIHNWYKDVLVGRITKNGFIWIIGTAWNELDLVQWLKRTQSKKMGGQYAVKTFKAGQEPCIWEEEWPKERLAERKREIGTVAYNRQMLNIPIGEMSQFIPMGKVRECQRLCTDPPGWFHRLDAEARQQFHWITAGVDLGMSRAIGNAETGIVVLGHHKDGFRHLIHCRSGLWVGTPILVQMLIVQHLFGVNEWLFETNAAQAHVAEMATDTTIMRALCKEDAELASLKIDPDLGGRLRMFGQNTGSNRNDERWGIRGLGPQFEALKFRIPGDSNQPEVLPSVEQLLDGLSKYSPFEHPADLVVGLWLAHVRMGGRGERLGLGVRSTRNR
ncbi:MAG: hypothetical protein OES13_00355 [Acidimicrobiia bacterium]|nr:hypothetical protein [Acidimicrobiia bacterium]